MTGVITRLKQLMKSASDDWRYRGVTNSLMDEHTWTTGEETLSIYWQNGAGEHAGYVVTVTSQHSTGLTLSNGYIHDKHEALVVADLHMRDEGPTPAAFMPSNRVTSEYGPGNSVRQDEWLTVHAPDYDFQVLDPTVVRWSSADRRGG